ncbi:MAG: hypothetical protein V4712_15075 [Pseudomonadota bacterium]
MEADLPPEPTFICQSAELEDFAHMKHWIAFCRDTAAVEGCTFGRFSWQPSTTGGNTIYLYEAWLTQPGDQGQPRFMLVAGV